MLALKSIVNSRPIAITDKEGSSEGGFDTLLAAEDLSLLLPLRGVAHLYHLPVRNCGTFLQQYTGMQLAALKDYAQEDADLDRSRLERRIGFWRVVHVYPGGRI